ncbi:MAG: DNA replication/repair protein RecF [Jatrophihabitans sp.]|nr:MAG: DNA replication/repair protein RecF [Jatrophihabitans sp.]
MYVRHLSLVDFRNWEAAELALEPGACVLVGANGQGKTNLVEAIGYVATLASHRVASDAPLIRRGAQRALVRAAIAAGGRELRVEIELEAGRANRARLNGNAVSRPRDVLGALRWVLFAPEDLAIVRGDPSERRRFLDDLAVARSPRLAGVRADYERVLKQRASLLKTSGAARRGGRSADLRALDAWDAQLASHGAQLLAARLATVRTLRPYAADAYGRVAPAGGAFALRYRTALSAALPELDEPDPAPDPAVLEAALLAQLAQLRPVELERGVNLAGPHRDDLELEIATMPVRGYASHGEGWSAALALRIGSFELMRDDVAGHPGSGDPVLVLDDVFAELDTMRRTELARIAAKAEQAVITAAVPADIPEELGGARYDVDGGAVRRVR